MFYLKELSNDWIIISLALLEKLLWHYEFFCQIAMRSFKFSPLQSFYLDLDLSGSAALGLEAQTTQKFSF